MEEIITIPLGDKIIALKVSDFDTDIDVEEILKIDYSNILGEILTFPVMFNRLANLKADQQEIISNSRTDIEIFEAELFYEKRKEFGSKGVLKPTKEQVETEVRMDARYRKKMEMHNERIKGGDYLDSLYWSAKLKCDLLTKISDKIRPEEFSHEVLTGTLNGIMIKSTEKLIK